MPVFDGQSGKGVVERPSEGEISVVAVGRRGGGETRTQQLRRAGLPVRSGDSE